MENESPTAPRRRRSRNKQIVLASATGLLVLAVCELTGLIGLAVVDGRLDFSTLHADQRDRAVGFARNSPPPLDEVLHPHLGWVLTPDTDGGVSLANTPQPIYIDDCCHYNQQGNRMLADAIADRLLTSPRLEPSARTSPRTQTRPN